MRRTRRCVTAAAAVLAALITASGCGIQSTPIHTYASAPIEVPVANAPTGQPTTATGRYPYWIYVLKGDYAVPVKRMAPTPPSLQYVVDSLLDDPPELGADTALDVGHITINPSGQKVQQYMLDYPYGKLRTQARWQLVCTVWQWAQQTRPANLSFQDRNYSVEFVSGSGSSGWHDCTEYTSTLPPGTKVPPSPATLSPRPLPSPAQAPTATMLPG